MRDKRKTEGRRTTKGTTSSDSTLSDSAPRPEIQHVQLAWECFKQLNGGCRTIAEVAAKIGQTADAIYRALSIIEAKLGTPIIKRVRGHKAEVIPEQETRLLQFGQLCSMYNEACRTEPSRPSIVLGCGLSFALHCLPDVLWEFSRKKDFQDYEIQVKYALPHELRERELTGEFDVAVTEFPSTQPVASHVGLFALPLVLIVPRLHHIVDDFGHKGELNWDSLAGCTVALLEHRSPMPSYPTELFSQDGIKIQYVRSHALIHALVASGRAITVSVAGLLSQSERSQVRVFGLPPTRTKLPSLSIALIRSASRDGAQPARSAATLAAINHFADCLEQKLKQMEEAGRSENFEGLPSTTHAYYVIWTPEGPQWIHGVLYIHVDPTGEVHGQYVHRGFVKPELDQNYSRYRDDRPYTISGKIEKHPNGQVHIVAEGERLDQQGREVFAVQFLAPSLDALKRPRLVGAWIGRQTIPYQAFEVFVPRVGYSVLLDTKEAKAIGTTDQKLTDLVREYERGAGAHVLRLEKPGEDKSSPR